MAAAGKWAGSRLLAAAAGFRGKRTAAAPAGPPAHHPRA
jgi:hypothetical protein